MNEITLLIPLPLRYFLCLEPIVQFPRVENNPLKTLLQYVSIYNFGNVQSSGVVKFSDSLYIAVILVYYYLHTFQISVKILILKSCIF